MSKKDLREADICDRYITPAIYKAVWKKSQVRREYYFTWLKMHLRGKRVETSAQTISSSLAD